MYFFLVVLSLFTCSPHMVKCSFCLMVFLPFVAIWIVYLSNYWWSIKHFIMFFSGIKYKFTSYFQLTREWIFLVFLVNLLDNFYDLFIYLFHRMGITFNKLFSKFYSRCRHIKSFEGIRLYICDKGRNPFSRIAKGITMTKLFHQDQCPERI